MGDRHNTCYPIGYGVFFFSNEACIDKVPYFCCDLFFKLYPHASWSLLYRYCIFLDLKLVYCHLWIKSRHLSIIPCETINEWKQEILELAFLLFIQGHANVSVGLSSEPRCISVNSSIVLWPPYSNSLGAFLTSMARGSSGCISPTSQE